MEDDKRFTYHMFGLVLGAIGVLLVLSASDDVLSGDLPSGRNLGVAAFGLMCLFTGVRSAIIVWKERSR